MEKIFELPRLSSLFKFPLAEVRIGIGELSFCQHSTYLGLIPPYVVSMRKESRAQAVELGEGSARTNILGKPFPTPISVCKIGLTDS